MKNYIILFVLGIGTAISIPFILDLLNTGEVDDESLSELIDGLKETDKVTKGIYYILYLILLPIAAIPVLKKKTHWKRGFIVCICWRKRFWFFNNWSYGTCKLTKELLQSNPHNILYIFLLSQDLEHLLM